MNIDNKQIITIINNYNSQKDFLNYQVKLGIINSDDAKQEQINMTQKERKLKEQFVFNNHITQNGEVRSINHHEPTVDNPKDYYITKMSDGKKIKATTYESLIEKLYEYYSVNTLDYSIKAVFEAAMKEKIASENPKQNTVDKNYADFKRYISEDIKNKDVRNMSELDIKTYIQQYVNQYHPKQKSFLSFKGILNLIFSYAYNYRIISENPLERINNKPYIKSCDTKKAKPEEKILSPTEIKQLQDEIRQRINSSKFGGYYINGYAMLFSIETGVRVGELCSIKWDDIKSNYIHIHSQQLSIKQPGGKLYYYAPYTKNEKGISEDGREFPLTKNIKELLFEIKQKQIERNINSEYIFCHEDGEWIKTDAYITFLRRVCQSKNFNVTNNHALRMSLNSNVLIPKGISVADRAALLGHSIETNLKHYSFAQKDFLTNICDMLDSCEGTPWEPQNVIKFENRKSPESLISQCF